MNLKNLHTENKAVQTSILSEPTEKVISLQIAAGEQLKEHSTKIPAVLVCVSGNAIYKDENGTTIELKNGDYVHIKADVKHSVDAIAESNLLLIK
jgi:quercetin dioxygenase-like cupin family protein